MNNSTKNIIYFDNAATTKIDPEVLEEMMPYLTEQYGNPGGLYKIGRNAMDAIALARSQVANFIGADEDQIIFTSGGSEANNLAIKSSLNMTGRGSEIITDQTEHDSVRKAINNAWRNNKVSYVPVNSFGSVDILSFCDKISPDTGFVSVMYVNNETGAVNQISEIGEICNKNGIIFHTDCVQAAGCKKLDTNKLKCDFMSISSHKIHGPKGVGALFVKNKELCSPLIDGGANQEFGLRGGTENVAGIIGFGKACEIAMNNFDDNAKHIAKIRNLFYDELMYNMTSNGISDIFHINGDYQVMGKTLNIRFDGVDAHTLVLMLDLYGVCVSAGSACTSHENMPSHVLLAMGLTPEEARSSIRISFSKMNTQDEAVNAAMIIERCVKTLLQ